MTVIILDDYRTMPELLAGVYRELARAENAVERHCERVRAVCGPQEVELPCDCPFHGVEDGS